MVVPVRGVTMGQILTIHDTDGSCLLVKGMSGEGNLVVSK